MARAVGRPHGLAAKNVRNPAGPEDGRRVLVDRLWPRGVSKERAGLSAWLRDLAPSTELRTWFAHDPGRWNEFRRRYREELEQGGQLAVLRQLREESRTTRVTLVFGSSDGEHNNAIALMEMAEKL